MKKIVVKSIFCRPLQADKPKCYTVVDETGVIFKSFDEGLAAVTAGAVLEVESEARPDGKFIDVVITAFKIISPASASTTPAAASRSSSPPAAAALRPPAAAPKMEPEMKVSTQAVERLSIESQTAAKIIAQLAINGIIKDSDPLFVSLKDWLGRRISAGSPLQRPRPAARAQLEQLELFQKAGKNIKQKVEAYHWNIQKLSDLSFDQAADLIKDFSSEVGK